MSSQPFTAFTDCGREGESAASQPEFRAQQPTAVLAQRDHVIRLREHEQSLGALANSVSTLRTMGGEIRSELLLQNSMLDNLDHGVDEVQRTLDAQQGRLRTLLIKSKLRWHYLTVFILVLILVILVWIRIGQ